MQKMPHKNREEQQKNKKRIQRTFQTRRKDIKKKKTKGRLGRYQLKNKDMLNIIRRIIIFVAIALILYAIFATIDGALARKEKAECLKWQVEAEQFEGYFLAGWQKQQCQHYKVIVK